MVDVVRVAHAVVQAQQIRHGGDDIVDDDVLRNQEREVFLQRLLEVLGIDLLHDFLQRGQVNLFVDAHFGRVEGQPRGRVHEVVADDLQLMALDGKHDVVDAGVFDQLGHVGVNRLARGGEDFAAFGIDNVRRRGEARDTVGNAELFIELVTAHAHEVVALGVEEERTQQRTRGIDCRRLAGAQALVDFKQAVFHRLAGIVPLDGGDKALVLAEELRQFRIGAVAQRAQKHRDGQLAGAVDAHPEHVVGVGLVFKPRAAVRDDLG